MKNIELTNIGFVAIYWLESGQHEILDFANSCKSILDEISSLNQYGLMANNEYDKYRQKIIECSRWKDLFKIIDLLMSDLYIEVTVSDVYELK